jgi:hypothetical protein
MSTTATTSTTAIVQKKKVQKPAPKEEEDEVDYLEEDAPIPSQKFAVLSFLDPREVCKQRELYFFQRFRQQYVVDTRLKCYETFMAFLANKHGIRVDDMMADFLEFKQIHEKQPELTYNDAEEAYKTFLMNHEESVQEDFNKEVDFKTNVYGIKVRKVFSSKEEAKRFGEKIGTKENHIVDTHIIEVGKWVPLCPTLSSLENVETPNKQLNEIRKRYGENREHAQQFFTEETERRKKLAREENRRKAAQAAIEQAVSNAQDEAAAASHVPQRELAL